MPQMKGDELAQRIQQRNPSLPIVMITAHAEMLESTKTPLPGIRLVISKPFLIDDLREAVRQSCPAAV
jgi:CheY-like chemotaxis protein